MISALATWFEANKPASVVTVGHAWGIEPVKKLSDVIPAVYFYPGNDEAEDAGYDFVEGAWTTEEVNCAIICEYEDLETLKEEIRELLIGYSAGATYTGLQLAGGAPIGHGDQKVQGSIIWWNDTYFTNHTVRGF